jgi:hypothetical protein
MPTAYPIWDGDTSTAYSAAGNWRLADGTAGAVPLDTDAVTFPSGCINPVAGGDYNGADAPGADLLSFTVKEGYSGAMGSMSNGFATALQIKTTTFTFAGSGVSYIDLTPNAVSTATVTGAAASAGTGLYGLHLASADAIGTLNIDLASGQSVGIAALAGTTGNFTTINVSGLGTVTLGSGLTATTLNIRGNGTVYQHASIANVNVIEGSPSLYLQSATAISTALTVQAGTVYEQSTGTKASVVIFEPANIICGPGARTWTATKVYGLGGLDDTVKSLGNVAVSDYGPGTNIHLGSNKTVTRGTI